MVEDEDGGEIVLTLRTFIGVTDSFLRQTSCFIVVNREKSLKQLVTLFGFVGKL